VKPTIGTVVCCAEIANERWRWIEEPLADTGLKFEFSRCIPKCFFEGRGAINLALVRGALHAVLTARRTHAKVLVTHGPTVAAWCAVFARVLRVPVPILAHVFNFTELPSGRKRRLFSWALSKVERFVVFSSVERDIYTRTFSLPADRFDIILWGVQPPRVEAPEVPHVPGDYVCAIGGNARDYHTLVEAARQLPQMQFVLVVRPVNLRGLTLPANVMVRANLPLGTTMNVLLHSKFMVLPLTGSEVPCGHVTLVSAMHLGKAFIITDSSGVRDYVRNGENALTVEPGSVESMVAAIKQLWRDPILCTRLGSNGQTFARRECTEERTVEHFRRWLASARIV
jgi:glycosyltransferase involved in cell wall biosynthesis